MAYQRMTKERKSERNRHPWSGFAIAATFWFAAVLFFLSPEYVGLEGIARIVFFVLASVCLVISLTGVFIELGRLYNNPGLRSWGTSLVFFIPAGLLHLFVSSLDLGTTLDKTLRGVVVILLLPAGGLFFDGIPYLLWNSEREQAVPREESGEAYSNQRDWNRIWQTLASIIVGILSLVTAVLSFTTELLR